MKALDYLKRKLKIIHRGNFTLPFISNFSLRYTGDSDLLISIILRLCCITVTSYVRTTILGYAKEQVNITTFLENPKNNSIVVHVHFGQNLILYLQLLESLHMASWGCSTLLIATR